VLLNGLVTPGATYDIQATTDLKNWTTIGNVTADASGALSFLDVNAPSFGMRYYRLRYQGTFFAQPQLKLNTLPGRLVRLSGLGFPARAYEVQASVDLTNWLAIGIVTGDAAGAFSLTDNNAPSFSKRFYRVRQLGAS